MLFILNKNICTHILDLLACALKFYWFFAEETPFAFRAFSK